MKLIVQISFAEKKLKSPGRREPVTLQNISRADFCNVISVLPYSPTNKGKQNIFDAVRKKLIDREKSRTPCTVAICNNHRTL